MDIVWKDIPFNLAENLTRLSQFMGAYTSVTMDKATKASTLLREKEERTTQLKQVLEAEKESANRQVVEKLKQLQQDMEVLKIRHEADISAKSMQLQEKQQSIERYKDVPTTEEFIKDALELNSLLMRQQENLCQKLSHITPYLTISDQWSDKEIDQRVEFNDLNPRISEFTEWQKKEDGKKANLPEIEETHKDILFTDWDARIKQVEIVVTRAAGVSKNNVKEINHILFTTNLIKEGNTKEMTDLTALYKYWQENVGSQRETITN